MSQIPVAINLEACTGCGLCRTVCPNDVFAIEGHKALITDSRCIACGHCQAICPTEAIMVTAIEAAPQFCSFTQDDRWLPHGQGYTAQLVRLMRSRRSCRNYTEQPVGRDLLADLVAIGTTAPSGTNSQKWTFTVLPTRQSVIRLGDLVAGYFARLNRQAANPLLRQGLKLLGKPALDNYFRRYYDTIAKGLNEWRKQGRDRLFHGATAAIIVGAEPGASCPMEDALLASQNILLAAHTMGLGSCLIGFAVAAMEKDNSIKAAITIPLNEPVYAVIALGYPAEKYQRPAGRKPVKARYIEG